MNPNNKKTQPQIRSSNNPQQRGQQNYQNQQQYPQSYNQQSNYLQQFSQGKQQYKEKQSSSQRSSQNYHNYSSTSIQQLPYRSQSDSFNQPAKNTIQSRFKLMPRVEDFTTVVIPQQGKGSYLTNYYEYKQSHQERDNIYLYTVETRPVIPPDSHDLWYRLIRSISKKIQKDIGVITFRANTIWGRLKNERPYITQTNLKGNRSGDQHQPKSSNQGGGYQIMIKMTKKIKLDDLYNSEDSASRPLFVQMVNNSIKERMHELGYFELGKGRFYASQDLRNQQLRIQAQGLTIMNGFKFTFISLSQKRSFLQIDTCSRILRTENFYETLMNTRGSPADKNERFKGATLLARYGNHKTYTIQEIEFSKRPTDTFPVRQNNQQIHYTFAEYLEKCYQIKVTAVNQPLIKAIAKVEKKIEKGKRLTKTPQAIYLIPEFMILTGMSDNQRESRTTMQQVANFVRTNPLDRQKRIDVLSQQINNNQMQIKSMAEMVGFKLVRPIIQAKHNIQINKQGSFEFKDQIYQEKCFERETWGLAYSNKVTEPEAFNCLEIIRQGGVARGVRVEDPFHIRLDNNASMKERLYSALRHYQERNKTELKFLVFLLSISESTSSIYNSLKNYCTLKLRIRTQFVLTSTLQQKREPVGGNVAMQMASKSGNKLWIVHKSHEHWKNRKVALASISFSRGKSGFSIALVGHIDNNQSSVYSYSMVNLSIKDQVPVQIYRNFFQNWLAAYGEREGRLPDSIVIYREGLSDVQIKKTVSAQLESLYESIGFMRNNPKCKNYSPEVALFIVNKKVNSKIYDFDPSNRQRFGNPTSGSVIFCQLASHGQIDFYLVAQKVDSQVGTATPTQYKLIYYKAEGQREEQNKESTSSSSSMEKCSLPLSALAQLTYEQCFNYDNWQGAIKIPAVLKYGDKMSTIVGEHICASVNLVEAGNQCRNVVNALKEEERSTARQKIYEEWKTILNSKWFL